MAASHRTPPSSSSTFPLSEKRFSASISPSPPPPENAQTTSSGAADQTLKESPQTPQEPPPPPSSKPTWSALFRFTSRLHAWPLVLALLASTFAGLTSPALSYLLGQIFNHFTSFGGSEVRRSNGPTSTSTAPISTGQELVHNVRKTCTSLAILGALTWLAYGLEFALWLTFGDLQARSARERVFASLLKKGVGWFDLNRDGVSALTSRFQTTTAELQRATSLPLGQVVRHVVDGVASFALAMSISWKLTLVTVAPIPLSIITLKFFSSRVKPRLEKESAHLSEAGKWVITSLSQIETVKAFNAQTQVSRRYALMIGQAARSFIESISWNAGQAGVIRFIALGMFVLGFWYGGVLVSNGQLDTGGVITTFYSAYTASKTFLQILPLMMTLDKGKVAGSQLSALERDESCADDDRDEKGRRERPEQCAGHIEFQNVSFCFPRRPEQYSLENVSIDIPAGETVFLIGGSGSGKSTTAQLLLGFYQSYTGTILLDGHDIRNLDLSWVRENITLVEQQSTLFSGSIEENIQLGKEGQPQLKSVLSSFVNHRGQIPPTNNKTVPSPTSAIPSAVEFANLTETISRLPDALATQVGPSGKGLSGGQRQRVALARAWIRNTPVLILDESTSALDYTNRSKVMEAIREWRQGRTTVIITHDMGMINPDDRVYVLDQAKVVASDRFSALERMRRVRMSVARPQSIFWDKAGIHARVEGEDGAVNKLDPFAYSSPIPGERLSRLDKARSRRSSRMPRPVSLSLSRIDGYSEFASHRDRRAEQSLPPKQARPPWRPNRNSAYRFTQDLSDLRSSLNECLDEFDRNTRPGSFLDFEFIPQLRSQRPASQISAWYADSLAEQRRRSLSRLSRISQGNGFSGFERSEDSCVYDFDHHHTEISDFADGKSITAAAGPPSIVTSSPTAAESDPKDPHSRLPRRSLLSVLATVWPNLSSRQRAHLMVAILAASVYAVCTPVFSYVFSLLMETYYLPTKNSAGVYSLIVLAIAFVDGVSTFIFQAGFQACGQRWVFSVRTRALDKVLAQPREFFDRDEYSVSRLGEALDNHAGNMQSILGRFIGYVLIVFVMATTALMWSFVASWKLTLVALGATPVIYGIVASYGKVVGLFDRGINDQAEAVGMQFLEVFASIRTVRALSLESWFQQKYFGLTASTFRAGVRKAIGGGVFAGLSSASFVFFVALIGFTAGEIAKSSRENVKSIVQVINILVLSISNVLFIIALIPHMSGSKDSGTRLLHLAELAAQSHEDRGDKELEEVRDISLDHLSFSYPSHPAHQVLEDVSFSVPAGSCVAIVGSSGSGKSTIASLLLRLYRDDACLDQSGADASGTAPIRINDLPLTHIQTRSLRQRVAIVSQTPVLFPMTVAENITYGLDPDEWPGLTTQENIERAAKAAGISDFISSLPSGYGTLVGEGGIGLSGGQAQRIGIARVLVRNPEVVILDEATSALDPESARLVRQSVKAFLRPQEGGVEGSTGVDATSGGGSAGGAVSPAKKRTVIVITHAKEMMTFADKVVVMDQGRVVQEGGFEELQTQEGPFQRLLKGEELGG